jgi:hypothetical protein
MKIRTILYKASKEVRAEAIERVCSSDAQSNRVE